MAELLQVTWLPASGGGGTGGLLHALASLSFLLLLAYLLLFLLAKLFARLHRAREDVAADHIVAGGERQQAADRLFWFDEAVFEDTALLGLGDEAKNHLLYTGAGGTAAQHCLEVAENSRAFHTAPPESTNRVSFAPREEEDHRVESDAATASATAAEEARVNVAVSVADDGVPVATDGYRQNIPVAASSSLPENDSVKGNLLEKQRSRGRDNDGDRPEDGRGVEEELEEKADGFPDVKRSIKCQPRSMSQRITHKLSMAAPRPKPRSAEAPAPAIGLRDPYPELERVYVAQICLTWEALNWNYTTFRRHNAGVGGTMMLEARCCPARVAQEFQQFQVLLYRFMENEPFEHGRRPEVYARMKNSSPKLLLVPEFREEEDEKDDLISAVQFLHILEESIRTFMAFLRADKRSHYQMFREMVRRRTSAGDQSIVITLKRTNKAKKSRLKALSRPRRCLKRIKVREEEEVAVLLGLIDLKVVARVLRMPEITDQQLHWCEEKMGRLRVDPQQGTMERDPSPLFFPAH
uniref:Uncharacterized protein n=1 Tax=Aegilops tauschii TaxID=37682 RepID=M8BYV8_AEGTA